MMQASKKIPFDDPNVLNLIRGVYILSNVIITSVYVYVKLQIDKKKGKRPLLHLHFAQASAAKSHRARD
jgi:hypothetical protein